MLEEKKCRRVKKGEKQRKRREKGIVRFCCFFVDVVFLSLVRRHRSVGRSIGRPQLLFHRRFFFKQQQKKRRFHWQNSRCQLWHLKIVFLFLSFFYSLFYSFFFFFFLSFSSSTLDERVFCSLSLSLFLARSRCYCIQNNDCSKHYYHLFQYLLFTSYGRNSIDILFLNYTHS